MRLSGSMDSGTLEQPRQDSRAGSGTSFQANLLVGVDLDAEAPLKELVPAQNAWVARPLPLRLHMSLGPVRINVASPTSELPVSTSLSTGEGPQSRRGRPLPVTVSNNFSDRSSPSSAKPLVGVNFATLSKQSLPCPAQGCCHLQPDGMR